MAGKYPTDPEVIELLNAFQAEQKLTRKRLALMIGMDGVTDTFLTKYLSDKLDRQVDGFDAKVRDIIRGLRERIAYGSEVLSSSVTRSIASNLNLIKKTGDIALITAPAGHGKTSAIRKYRNESPAAIAITLNETTRKATKVEGLVYNAVTMQPYGGRVSRWDVLTSIVRGSGRLLIIDNAHRLDGSGRKWVFDFADETETPVALVGNPEILDAIRGNDQQFSRIGIHVRCELDAAEIPALAKAVATQFSNEEFAEETADLLAIIGGEAGRLRAVKKAVKLAMELIELKPDMSPVKALRAAHKKLVRDYVLPV